MIESSSSLQCLPGPEVGEEGVEVSDSGHGPWGDGTVAAGGEGRAVTARQLLKVQAPSAFKSP